MFMRQSGILLHITSLPSGEGIGTLGDSARRFVDFLVKAGMRVWQTLPISPTGFAESPYQCFSTYAGNPLLIDLKTLIKQGILTADLPPDDAGDPEKTDFSTVIPRKRTLLDLAFLQSGEKLGEKITRFRQDHAGWIEDFALFMAIKAHFHHLSWQDWPDDDIRMRRAAAMKKYSEMLKPQVDSQVFTQYLFFEQWHALKRYANGRGILLFGDMPIYVAQDSADAWANPRVFQLDHDRRPTHIAGVPPDYFSADGQRWGNPLYNWRYLKKTGYRWWIERLRWMNHVFDMTRVDHFIGFANYYAVPAQEATARKGVWLSGPGKDLFDAVKRELPDMRIVAEDLGAVNQKVRRLVDICGYPGMKVMTFAFSGDPFNEHLPKYHTKNTVVYTGTHDNNTLQGWWNSAAEIQRNALLLALSIKEEDDLNDAVIQATLCSPADTAIIPMQDILKLPESARMNLPGTVGGNWLWRMKPDVLNARLAKKLLGMNSAAHRAPAGEQIPGTAE